MGVGMPQGLLLNEFGSHVFNVFGHVCYHVGSSLANKDGWRDVDVRLILDDAEWDRLGYGEPRDVHNNAKWRSTVLVWSGYGRLLTGLPIDFQPQRRSAISESDWNKPRSALFTVTVREGVATEKG